MCANLVGLSSFVAVRLGPKLQHRICDRLQQQPTQTTGAASFYSSSIKYNSDAQQASTILGIDQPTHLVSLLVHSDALLDLCRSASQYCFLRSRAQANVLNVVQHWARVLSLWLKT